MSYLEERAKLQKELEVLEEKFKIIEQYLNDNPQERYCRFLDADMENDILKMRLRQEFHYWETNNDSTLMLKYKLLKFRISQIKSELSKTEGEWRTDKVLKTISDNMPKHVSGRVYTIGDGCATICMWIAFVVFIISLLSYLFQ